MPERDAFDAAYGRLAATRLGVAPPPPRRLDAGGAGDTPALRWAASRLLPRLTALAPRRRDQRPAPAGD